MRLRHSIACHLSQIIKKITKYNPGIEASGGVANVQGVDRTGGPLSTNVCSSCHGGGNFTPTMNITVLDGTTPITSYTPGMTYNLVYSISTANTPAGYGMQAVALTSSNNEAGSLAGISANSQLTLLNGLNYLEHSGVSTSSDFTATWTAPSTGTGVVNFYAMGLAVNNFQGIQGDQATTPASLSLSESVPSGGATINYSSVNYCATSTNQSPTINGNTNGTFSSTTGLLINSGTGVIDIAGSSPGAYDITYTYPTGSTSTSIEIHQTYSESATAEICDGDSYIFGSQTLTALDEGINTETFQTVNGCDSIVELTLSLTTTDLSTSLAANQISANQSNAVYQWINCDTGNSAIVGETNQSFSPSADGNYAVEITLNNCVSISSCVAFELVGLNDLVTNQLRIYPNPVSDFLTIEQDDESLKIRSVVIQSISGQTVSDIKLKDGTLDLSALNSGIYILQVYFDDHSMKRIEFIKE